MLLQYFVNYNLKKGHYRTGGPSLTPNWNARGSDQHRAGTIPAEAQVACRSAEALVRSGDWALNRRELRRGVSNSRLLSFIRRFPRKNRRLEDEK